MFNLATSTGDVETFEQLLADAFVLVDRRRPSFGPFDRAGALRSVLVNHEHQQTTFTETLLAYDEHGCVAAREGSR